MLGVSCVNWRSLVLNSHSSKFDKAFNYSLVAILIILGLVIISGIFRSMPADFRNIFGGIILVYGVVRLLLLSSRYRREKQDENQS